MEMSSLKRSLLIFYLLLLAQPGWASFLDAGFGARPKALGNTFVAVADDANTVYWNAAGMSSIQTAEVTSAYSRFFDEVSCVNVAYVMPVGEGSSLGLGYIRSSVGEIPNTDAAGNLISYMSNTDQALMLAYGKKLNNNLSMGLSLKMISMALDENSNSGFDMDCSLLYRLNRNFSLGGSVQNMLAGPLGPDRFERKVKVGVAYAPWADGSLVSADLNYAQNKTTVNYGVEWALLPIFKVRGGIGDGRFSAGLGLYFEGFIFDYAFSRHDLGNVSAFAITIYP